jgi:hypothetical protein
MTIRLLSWIDPVSRGAAAPPIHRDTEIVRARRSMALCYRLSQDLTWAQHA